MAQLVADGGRATRRADASSVTYNPLALARGESPVPTHWTIVLGVDGGGGIVPPNTRAKVRMGTNDAFVEWETDWRRGVTLPAYGARVTVEVVPPSGPVLGADENDYATYLSAFIVPGVANRSGVLTYSIEFPGGQLREMTTVDPDGFPEGLRFKVPPFARTARFERMLDDVEAPPLPLVILAFGSRFVSYVDGPLLVVAAEEPIITVPANEGAQPFEFELPARAIELMLVGDTESTRLVIAPRMVFTLDL